MKCPHCLTAFHPEPIVTVLEKPRAKRRTDPQWQVWEAVCPACNRSIVALTTGSFVRPLLVVFPQATSRPVSPEVPEEFASDFTEACVVLSASPKASAALSRRCLQRLLRGPASAKPKDLKDEIDEVVPKLPSELGDLLHHVRVIGNFAAHPNKNTNTGEVIDVEPGEAEWMLGVLEELFDYYFVRPTRIAERKAKVEAMLAEAGKKPLPA
jgi:hypothetical protein